MVTFYKIGISAIRFLYWSASWFNPKAKALRIGHEEQADKLRTTFPLAAPEGLVWLHCASLGEFEQGRPVIEALKADRKSVV